ncbi:MAG TPA: FkbM family methyltransferase [Candidatus Sulfotelmatobacter sp.]|nr:FkbM family methyltransferase [Candidatus Sulfotelmatobacter sp.]
MDFAPGIRLKKHLQLFLKGIGLYERLQASRMRDLYWSCVDRHMITDRTRELQFYRTALSSFQKRDLIFDIGANEGSKTDIFLRLGAKVLAVEPDETNVETLRGKFLRNRIFPKPVIIEGKAVSDRPGRVRMLIDAPGSALNTLSPKWANTLRGDTTRFGQQFDFTSEKEVETTTLEALMETHGVPFYIKIDVEGHELNVLRGLKRPVPFLSFEVNLPEFREEGLECARLLQRLSPDGEFNCLVDQPARLKFPSWLQEREFLNAYRHCSEPMIEIFWRSRNVLPPGSC